MSGPAVIVDIGSGFIKAGLRTDENPRAILPSLVGRPRRRYSSKYDGEPAFVGDDAISRRHELSFTYPIDHGHVDDWLEIEELFNYLFHTEMAIDLKDHPVLLTEPPLASQIHREKLAEVIFELYDAPELNLSLQGIMALYSTGRSTGLVVEVGEGVTQVVPVYEGYTDKSCIKRSDFGGQELTMYLQKLLCDNGYAMTSRDDYENVRLIKESVCYVAVDPAEEDLRDDLNVTHTLPDGMTLRDGVTNTITLGPERFYCPEALFDPHLLQRDNPPLTELIWQAVQASPMETRRSALGAVILSGGSTLFPGLPERLTKEIKQTSPPQARSSVRVIANDDRLFADWLGAQSFCDPGIRSMQDHLWTTSEDWAEVGPSIVHKKVALRQL
eukprot:CAMPEP_0113856596 /NCGR_PEP_ID=MMETSP0372-20130328/9353_1 /TAXON_ID=340204 /ORGANISM="Lankesteria abbotti" /LENGTH=385 /DNA_ID=CAMNT_0000831673 /DNA_START=98 /DNA_END=1255 /DNA_ORIENTATION=+ /assembly_acc=CAM_ASM_000359